MKKLILLVGAAALVSTAAVAAQPNHGRGQGHTSQAKGNQGANNNGRANRRAGHGVVTSDRHGRLYALDARGSCPPGLARRNNGCIAPGQAKKQYNVGQRYNRSAGNLWSYNQIPDALRSQHRLDQSNRYYYNSGYLYQVDPRSMVVQRVISAILR
jgi:hypothetical protein